MAHIDLGVDEREFPGITGPLHFRPEVAGPLAELAEVLLRGPHPLSPGERELIATYVSSLNECRFCAGGHSCVAAAQLDGGMPLVQAVLADVDTAPVPPKLRALLHLAAAVQRGGREVTPTLVEAARSAGATDLEIHDTVLIAAAFCMYNRYVDGLGTYTPPDIGVFNGPPRVVTSGYLAR